MAIFLRLALKMHLTLLFGGRTQGSCALFVQTSQQYFPIRKKPKAPELIPSKPTKILQGTIGDF